jgi:hypothetical protein
MAEPNVVEIKTLNQDMPDSLVACAGETNGRNVRVIVSQEAAARMTPLTKLYLKWAHRDTGVEGYNVFTKVNDNVYDIVLSKDMLVAGTVLCRIEFVDEVSISATKDFTIDVEVNPHDGEKFVPLDDFTEFQQACVDLATVGDALTAKVDSWREEIDEAFADETAQKVAMQDSDVKLKVYRMDSSSLDGLPVEDGNLVFVEDTGDICLDGAESRVVYSAIKELVDDAAKDALENPVKGFYFVEDTNVLWRYTGEKWVRLAPPPEPPKKKERW